jgi:hypothetical protein
LFQGELKDRYVAAVEHEIRGGGHGEPADTIFFGGGTPSLLDPAEIRRLIKASRESFSLAPDAENHPRNPIPKRRLSSAWLAFVKLASPVSVLVSNHFVTRN